MVDSHPHPRTYTFVPHMPTRRHPLATHAQRKVVADDADPEVRQQRGREQAKLRMRAYRARLKQPGNQEKRREAALRSSKSSEKFNLRKRLKETCAEDDSLIVASLVDISEG
ncbi:hypothetical protein MKEN_00862600 [Mycena kentingensis (nom. inval.)]|nr:hypothetical protein MKEN_00862600 [Mycena kentingensis (nom. inval.)]